MFLTQPVCMVPNQNTRNIYLRADNKQCIDSKHDLGQVLGRKTCLLNYTPDDHRGAGGEAGAGRHRADAQEHLQPAGRPHRQGAQEVGEGKSTCNLISHP